MDKGWKINFYRATIKALIVLVPSYAVALIAGKMVYVLPMMIACGFVAASIFSEKTDEERVDEDTVEGESADIGG